MRVTPLPAAMQASGAFLAEFQLPTERQDRVEPEVDVV
jgi:hypothetical protein